jgi:hypothetical protein
MSRLALAIMIASVAALATALRAEGGSAPFSQTPALCAAAIWRDASAFAAPYVRLRRSKARPAAARPARNTCGS